MRPVHRGRPDQGDLDVGAAGDEFGEVLEVTAHPAIAQIGRMRSMLRRFFLADGMVGRGINGAAAEDEDALDTGRPGRLQHLSGEVEVLGDAGHGMVGAHAGAGHRARRVKD